MKYEFKELGIIEGVTMYQSLNPPKSKEKGYWTGYNDSKLERIYGTGCSCGSKECTSPRKHFKTPKEAGHQPKNIKWIVGHSDDLSLYKIQLDKEQNKLK